MSVRAHTNAFGYFDRFTTGNYTMVRKRNSNGQSDPAASGSVTLIDNHCERFHKSSNPPTIVIDGTPFRRSSQYYRKIIQHDWVGAKDFAVIDGRYTYTYNGNHTVHTDIERAMSGPWLQDEGFYDQDGHNRSIVECLNKLNDGKVSMSTYLGEVVRSADTLAKGITTLGLALIAVKRRQFRWLARRGFGVGATRHGANIFLEYQYGWKPLIEDVYAMCGGLQDSLTTGMYLKAKRSVRTNHYNGNDIEYSSNRYVGYQTTDILNKTVLTAKVKDDLIVQAQNIDVLNPLSLGWELIPYSFVIDWGIPVGNVLSALTATSGLEFVDGCSTEVRNGKLSRTVEPLSGNYTGSPERVNCKLFAQYRGTHNGFPRPIPYGKNPFSTNHVMSATALWRQLSALR